ncbi:unnamed protein product [Parnassius mnemosyne]|uniref:Uncharacterized protein n=1 Tax=Parnassius mnemosyne TaxID=213953 RepID=A0AAV1KPA8_9NEOP
MPLSAAEKMRRRREKLKEPGKYDEYKEKIKQACRKTRQKKKEEIERIPLSKKAKVIIENRRKTKERVRKHRLQKKQNEQTNTIVNETSIRVTPQSIGKTVVRARNALPACPIKKQLVLGRLLDECPKESPPTMHGASGLNKKVIFEIQTCYQRDDISRQAPGLKDYVTVRNERGEKEKMQIRHLFSSVTETHSLFVQELGNIVGRNKFAELRPKHVYLSSKLPHNVKQI